MIETLVLWFILACKSSIPAGPLSVTKVSKNSCQLHWNRNSRDVPVQHYEVYKRIDGYDEWELCNAKAEFTCLTVPNLSPETTYYFQVVAVNNEGRSEPLETAESIRTERKDEIIYKIKQCFI